MENYIVSSIILIMHLSICIFGTLKNQWRKVPYFTDFIENFEFSVTRPFTILILTLIYSNVIFDKNVDDNFENFNLSWSYICLILNILMCIFVTGVLVHTLSEDALSKKLHLIYAFIAIFLGNLAVFLDIFVTKDYSFGLYSILVYFIFNSLAIILLLKQYTHYNNIMFNNYTLPICEHLFITSSMPIYFEKYIDKFSFSETYVKMFFLYFFIYCISNTEIRRNPKFNTEQDGNYYSLLFYKRKRNYPKWYHKLLIPVDLFCIVFNLYKIDGLELENRFFENIYQDRVQQFCGVGGFEITIFEPSNCICVI